ncbi:MAG: hypothetical protein FWB90_04420 [Fibromonadales bacterium]|nr:hypothetical protein [Fibromonadales bacterium]
MKANKQYRTIVKTPNEIFAGHEVPGEILIDDLESLAQDLDLTIEKAKEFASAFYYYICGRVVFEKVEVTEK